MECRIVGECVWTIKLLTCSTNWRLLLHLVQTLGDTGFKRSARRNQFKFQQRHHFIFVSSDNDNANLSANANAANLKDSIVQNSPALKWGIHLLIEDFFDRPTLKSIGLFSLIEHFPHCRIYPNLSYRLLCTAQQMSFLINSSAEITSYSKQLTLPQPGLTLSALSVLTVLEKWSFKCHW